MDSVDIYSLPPNELLDLFLDIFVEEYNKETRDDTYVIAIDFESAGFQPHIHGFTQLGACLVRVKDSRVMAKFSEYANMTGYEWSDRCVREFWSKNPELYEETKAVVYDPKTPSPKEVIAKFAEWVTSVTAVPEVRAATYVISDNVAFDVAILRAFADYDILQMFGGYREMVDVSSAYMGMSHRPVTVKLMNESAKELACDALSEKNSYGDKFKLNVKVDHDHHAVNDAIAMALAWSQIQRELVKRNDDGGLVLSTGEDFWGDITDYMLENFSERMTRPYCDYTMEFVTVDGVDLMFRSLDAFHEWDKKNHNFKYTRQFHKEFFGEGSPSDVAKLIETLDEVLRYRIINENAKISEH